MFEVLLAGDLASFAVGLAEGVQALHDPGGHLIYKHSFNYVITTDATEDFS